MAITWDPVDYAKPVDLDLQAIIIDKRGYIEAGPEFVGSIFAAVCSHVFDVFQAKIQLANMPR